MFLRDQSRHGAKAAASRFSKIRNTSNRYSLTSGCAINCNQRQTNEAKKNGITSHFSILQFVVHFVSGSLDLAVGANRPLALRPIIVAIDIHLCQCIVSYHFVSRYNFMRPRLHSGILLRLTSRKTDKLTLSFTYTCCLIDKAVVYPALGMVESALTFQ